MLQIVTTQLSLSTTTQTQTGLLICSLSLLIWKHLPGHCLCYSLQQGRWLDYRSKNSQRTTQSPEPASPLHHFALWFLKPILCLIISTCCFYKASRIKFKYLAPDFSTLSAHHASPSNLCLRHNTSLPLPKKCCALRSWSLYVSACAVHSDGNTFICSPLFSTSPTSTTL